MACLCCGEPPSTILISAFFLPFDLKLLKYPSSPINIFFTTTSCAQIACRAADCGPQTSQAMSRLVKLQVTLANGLINKLSHVYGTKTIEAFKYFLMLKFSEIYYLPWGLYMPADQSLQLKFQHALLSTLHVRHGRNVSVKLGLQRADGLVELNTEETVWFIMGREELGNSHLRWLTEWLVSHTR